MFETSSYSLQELYGRAPAAAHKRDDYLALEARQLYGQARLGSNIRSLWAKLTGRHSRLLDLKACASRGLLGDGHYSGLRPVPLSQIQGSEGRLNDFDSHLGFTAPSQPILGMQRRSTQ